MTRKKIPPLNIERIDGSGNLLFLSLIEYKHSHYLCVINHCGESDVEAYVLDYAEQNNINVANFLRFVTHWFYSAADKYPLSIEIAKNNLTKQFAPIFKTFDTAHVSRIVGSAFFFESLTKTKVKRRRTVPLPENVEIRFKKLLEA